MKKRYVLLAAIVCLAVGFFTGRQTITKVVEYSTIKLPPISGSFSRMKPLVEEYPKIPDLPMKPDTVYRDSLVYIAQKVDTAAIIAEYQLKRTYAETLFDNNQHGKLDITLTTQYNRLADLSYVFTPIQQVRTIERMRVWQPFVFATYNSLNYVGAGAGLYYHDIGVSGKYMVTRGSSGWEIGLHYKF